MHNLRDVAASFCESCSKEPSIFKLSFNGIAAGNTGGQQAVTPSGTDRTFEF
jgi:hypothetical protein